MNPFYNSIFKYFIIITSLILILIGCKNKHPNSDKKLADLSHWLIKNEEELYKYLLDFIKKDPRLRDNSTFQVEYTIDTLQFRTLNNKIAEIDSCIVAHIIYKPREKKSFEILLTSDFKTKCSNAIDNLFLDIDSLQFFQIIKYRAANTNFGELINEPDTILPQHVKFSIQPSGNKYDLTAYFTKQFKQTTMRYLIEEIFGEEALEKRIDTIDYKILKNEREKTLKSIEEVQAFFNTK